MDLQDCVWENHYQIIINTILQEKETIHYSTTIWFTNLFLCLKPWQQMQQWTRNGKNWRQNTKRTTVGLYSEAILSDDSGSCAVFTEQGSSASQMTAAEVMDIISRLPGCDGQAADAVSAYTQVKMEDAPKIVVRIPNMSTFRAFRSFVCLSVFACTLVHSNSLTTSTDSLARIAGALTKQLSVLPLSKHVSHTCLTSSSSTRVFHSGSGAGVAFLDYSAEPAGHLQKLRRFLKYLLSTSLSTTGLRLWNPSRSG